MFLLGEISIFQQRTSASLWMVMLATLMFNAGLGLKSSDLADLMQKKYLLLAGLAANLIIPIIYIYSMAMRLRQATIRSSIHSCGPRAGRAMPIAGSCHMGAKLQR